MNVPCFGEQRTHSMAGKDRAGPVILQQDDVVRLSCRSLLHAGRADRHSRDCESLCRGSLRQQPPDVSGGHMPFDDVTINHRRVAGLQFTRDASFRLYATKIFGVMDVDGEAGGSQMSDPLPAAAAAWVLVDYDLRSFGILLANKEGHSPSQRNNAGSHREKHRSPFHESLHDLRFDAFEEVNQFGEFFALLRKSPAPQRLLDAASGMRLEDFILDPGERTLHRLHLMQDIDTVPVGLDHANEAARLTLDPLETIDDGGPIPAVH